MKITLILDMSVKYIELEESFVQNFKTIIKSPAILLSSENFWSTSLRPAIASCMWYIEDARKQGSRKMREEGYLRRSSRCTFHLLSS
jgi:hypothetical protein